MQTILLAGMSLKNKDWMDQIITSIPSIDFTPVYWDHWQLEKQNATEFAWELEITKVHQLATGPVNILAKSIGSVVASRAINTGLAANKVVLCGLPFSTISEARHEIGECLKKINPANIHIIQNEQDPLCSFADALAFVQAINPKISVISQSRDDHNYPYPQLFEKFLS